MSTPNYSTHDPRGWGGDPSRGAALGRATIAPRFPESQDFAGKVTLRRVYLNAGGYDRNGTYFGCDRPLFWYAASDPDGETIIDAMLRADSRADAKAQILRKFPRARFYR